ncbi:MAG: formate dehydrogenase N subunit beta transmembrane domain-containing protein, partial [Planctomycetota bacterium]
MRKKRSRWRRAALGLAIAVPAVIVPMALVLAAGDEHEEAGPHEQYYVHRIRLLDAERNPIDASSTVPYSPRQTCSSPECHSYEEIERGMHFVMGHDRMSDDWGAKHRGEPWHLSPGMAGGFLPTFRRQFARKENDSAAEIDMTAYEFVQACGPCHPGGGVMEYDRDGERYDLAMAEAKDAGDDPADSLDGDYHGSRWHQSGVVEIDCLLCHAQWQYDNDERVAQLRYENYAFAATAAAGFGLIQGKVSEATDQEVAYDPMNPTAAQEVAELATVQYDPRLFDSQGYVTLDIGRPSDHTCLFCHHLAALEDAEGFVHINWDDVHTTQGLACVDCHAGGDEHNFELGRRLHYSVGGGHGTGAPEHEAAPPPEMSCEGCHESGFLGAPLPRHTGFPRFHFDEIACTTCHVGPALTVQDRGVEPVLSDTSASTPQTAGIEARYPDQQAPWQIAYHDRGGQLRVHNCQQPWWWGQHIDDYSGGIVWPYFLREVAPAFNAALDDGEINDDDGDGTPEVNIDAEIVAMDTALRKALDGGRFETVQPALVKGDQVLMAEDGEVKALPGATPQAVPGCVTLSHVVLGPQQAVGAGGCTDCHCTASYVLNGKRVVNPMDAEGAVHTRAMGERFDYGPTRLALSDLREELVKPVGLLLLPLTVVACLLHYVLFGPKRVQGDDPDAEVARFGGVERVMHLLLLLAFVVLAVSGLGFLAASRLREAVPSFWTSETMEAVHRGTGYVFVLASVAMIVRWLPTALFRKYDV